MKFINVTQLSFRYETNTVDSEVILLNPAGVYKIRIPSETDIAIGIGSVLITAGEELYVKETPEEFLNLVNRA